MKNLSKDKIRKEMAMIRDALDKSKRAEYDKAIFERLIESSFYKNASSVFTYVSFKSEVDTFEIIRYSIDAGKLVCVPKINKDKNIMEAYKINGIEDLRKGYFGILEPLDYCNLVDKSAIDIALMPGLAFDREGGRIGYGKGFYDRYLYETDKPFKIGLAYSFQVIDKIPVSEFDVKVDCIITEKGEIDAWGDR